MTSDIKILVKNLPKEEPPLSPKKLKRKLNIAYLAQKHSAIRRGIAWNFTEKDWVIFWFASGKLNKRGKGRGKYVMARVGDMGPYEIGNVKIVLGKDNIREAHLGVPEKAEAVEKSRKSRIGLIHSKKARINMSNAQKRYRAMLRCIKAD